MIWKRIGIVSSAGQMPLRSASGDEYGIIKFRRADAAAERFGMKIWIMIF
jgi:hypothetical protein